MGTDKQIVNIKNIKTMYYRKRMVDKAPNRLGGNDFG